MSSWDSRRRSSQPGSSSRLRMDSYSTANRASRTRAVSPKRRELDNVMKKARRDGPTQSNYWNKKLLEAEEKDPNRWRHSGFKELYGGGGGGASSPVGSRSSYRRSRSRSRSRLPRRSRSRARSPLAATRPRSRDRTRDRRPHTPQPQVQKVQSPPRGSRPPGRRSSRIASLSGSSRSLSSCSDESCSVCSPKNNKKVAPPPKYRSRSRSFSVPRNRPTNRSPVSPGRGAADLRRVRDKSSPPRDPRRPPTSPPGLPARNKVKVKRKEGRDKGSGLKKRKSRSKSGRRKRRRPALAPEGTILHRASPLPSASEDSSTSSMMSGCGATRLTLSERFGKMAQWSVDRRDFDGVKNMRITKEADSSDLKVVIEGDRYRSLSPAPVSDRRVGLGYYPETLHSAPVGLDAWDDVRVRYKYYKDRGYLRDLTLEDYVKWEEWWYKYQDWLEAERYYEHWAALRAEEATRTTRRRRARR